MGYHIDGVSELEKFLVGQFDFRQLQQAPGEYGFAVRGTDDVSSVRFAANPTPETG